MSQGDALSIFVRLLRGEVADLERLRGTWESGYDRLGARAGGWLAATAGVTPAGQWLAAIRYASEEAARRNEERPEYAQGWRDLQAALGGPAQLDGSADVHAVSGNGSGPPGFVQMMRARVRDRQRLEEVEASMGDQFASLRPDFIGGLRIWHGADRVTVVDSFTSEAEARAGEAKEMPEDLKVKFGAWMGLLDDVEWYDLAEPWLG